MTEAFRNCLKRFPVTVCFALALTVFLLYLATADRYDNEKLFWVLGYYFSIGTLLSLSLHLWSEEVESKVWEVVVQAVPHALLIVDAVFLYSLSPERSLIEIGIAHGAGILALGISIFFLSFTKEENDIPSWNFASYTVSAGITVNLIGLIMSGGICLLLLSLNVLFDIDATKRSYLSYTFIICSVLLPMLLFLGMLPQGAQKHNRRPQPSAFFNGIIHFLFLPLMAGYLLVLYIYAARIFYNWELPNGWVSWLIVVLMAGCIAVEFGLYPARIKEAKRIDQWIARWLPALILPMLLLMTIGIVRRLNDYGVTINRLYLITLNVWFYMVCIGLIVSKARRISWIPVSFAVIFLLTSVPPVNYASITRNTIRNSIKKELQHTNETELPLSSERYDKWLSSLPDETAILVNTRFIYLNNWFGRTSTNDLVEGGTSFYSSSYRETNTTVDDTVIYSGEIHAKTAIEIPDGYTRFVHIGTPNKRYSIPHKEVEKGILPVFLDTKTGQTNDTVYIDLETLGMLHDYKYGDMPPTTFKCNSNKCLFLLTYFELTYNEGGKNDAHLNLDGYLFKK